MFVEKRKKIYIDSFGVQGLRKRKAICSTKTKAGWCASADILVCGLDHDRDSRNSSLCPSVRLSVARKTRAKLGAMTFTGGFGYALIALGPAIALFFTVIVGKPFLILTLIASILSWLVSLVLISSVWRAFLPGESSVWVYIPLLLSAVGCQEAARLMFWHIYLRVEDILNKIAGKLSKPRLHAVDKFEIALAFGLGHGLAHVIFFSVSLLTPSFGPATFYVNSCSQMPFFMMTALTGLGFLLIHTFSMIIAFDGHAEGKKSQQIFAPGMHILASFSTLANLAQGGCVYGVSATLSCALVTSAVCWKIEWDKTSADTLPSSSSSRTHH